MKSATAMSLEIRRRKKDANKPETDDAVDLSGIPDDATDQLKRKQNSLTDDLGMDTNKPKDHEEEPTAHQVLMEDSSDRAHEAPGYDEDMELKNYADGGMVGGRGAIAGGEVPKHTELAKINGFSDGGEVDEAKMKRKARISKMMGR